MGGAADACVEHGTGLAGLAELAGEGAVDSIWLAQHGAPCSGLGSLRRRPESRWTHRLEDLEEMVPLQQGLLQRGIEVTRRGGVLAWVTCTPQVEETIDLVEWALGGGNVELVDTNEVAEKLSVLEFPGGVPVDSSVGDEKRDSVRADITRNSVQLWPHIHGTDAMFVALLRKI